MISESVRFTPSIIEPRGPKTLINGRSIVDHDSQPDSFVRDKEYQNAGCVMGTPDSKLAGNQCLEQNNSGPGDAMA